jgi:hypothetical protein
VSNTLQIKRDGSIVHSVKIADDSSLVYQLMGEHKVDAKWVSASPLELILGDYIELGLERFYLNTLPQVIKSNNFAYSYSAIFESELYKLFNKILLDEGAADFSYFGTPEEMIDLILTNMNSIDTGWTSTVVDAITPISISFNGDSCRQALSKICEEFGLEFRLSQREIIVARNVGFASTYVLEYGRGKGLYSLDRQSVIEKGVITRLYAFGAEKNLGFDYRSGARRLVFETGDPAVNYLQANVELYGIKEGTVTFEDIYPQRTGEVTATANKNTIIDASIDFNLNEYLLEGTEAKIVFKSGSLAGYEFTIKSYNHASRSLVFNDFVEANDEVVPGGSFVPEIGDQYTLVNIKMPESYVVAAEAELLAAATDYLEKVKAPRVTYTLDIDEKFVRSNGVELGCGMKVRIVDSPLGLDDEIRIFSISWPLVNPSRITAQIADSIPATVTERIIKATEKGKADLVTIDRSRAEDYRNAVRRIREIFADIYDPDGYFDMTNIRPGSIETLALAIGANSQNFGLSGVELEANFEGDPNRIRISGGELIHFEIEIESLGYIWTMDSAIINGLTSASKYYLYGRCNRSALTGSWVVSETPIKSEEEPGFYHFWLGILYPVADGLRYFMFTKGMTFIVGDTITTGRIKSLDGLNFFDLSEGVFNLGTETNGLDWGITNEGKLTIRGAIITDALFADDGVIQNLRVSSLKTESTGKRIEILATDELGDPLHNLKFYDENGDLAITLDTDIDGSNSGAASAGIRIQKAGTDRIGLMSQNGILSEGSFLTSGSLPTNQHLGSVLGVLKSKFFTAFGIRAGVIGYDATDPAAGSPSYGGWFNTIQAGGLNIGVKQVTTNYTATLEDTLISCYNTATISVSLPANPRAGKVILVRTNMDVPTQIIGNGKQIKTLGLVNSIALPGTNFSRYGRLHQLIFDGSYWLYNSQPVTGVA